LRHFYLFGAFFFFAATLSAFEEAEIHFDSGLFVRDTVLFHHAIVTLQHFVRLYYCLPLSLAAPSINRTQAPNIGRKGNASFHRW